MRLGIEIFLNVVALMKIMREMFIREKLFVNFIENGVIRIQISIHQHEVNTNLTEAIYRCLHLSQ